MKPPLSVVEGDAFSLQNQRQLKEEDLKKDNDDNMEFKTQDNAIDGQSKMIMI